MHKMTKIQKRLWTGLAIMVLLSPLGIILPALFDSGGAWGEWGTDTLERMLGYLPEGLKKYADVWNAPVPDYGLGGEGSSTAVQAFSYISSGLLGILIIVAVIYLLIKLTGKDDE